MKAISSKCGSSRRSLMAALALVLGALAGTGLSGCATADDSGGTITYPDPAEKQYRMQEKMSQVTRSFL
ncbi:MAG: hypothetical protein JNK37_18390 [Verrucomicrobiales bacterium]|nr:hypothetical protein [Verrucomicrobiales bacterium]